ncbi:MAG: virulence RhuM family protein [Cardiobacteriaceae bacterium]|nr:virulence RhuM family protein [Cardiobacteriaceae bacterium]
MSQQIVFYQTDNTNIVINIHFQDETFWLNQKEMAELFEVNVPAISKHLANIYAEEELEEQATVSKMEIVRQEGNRSVKRQVDYYNLDAIIAVGYRVNSKKATRFRQNIYCIFFILRKKCEKFVGSRPIQLFSIFIIF